MSVIALFLLSSLGIAMTVQAQECSRPEGGPNMDLKDEDINLQSFPDGTRVTFTCDVGYRATGRSPSITCTAGTWSPVQLKCEIKNCGSAGEVTNGNVDYPDGTNFGAQVVVTCRTGYMLVGKGRLTCSDQGWMGRLQTCEVRTCYPPPEVPSVTFTPIKENYEYRDVILFSCQKDFTLDGSKSLTCSEDGTFKPERPACVRVECPAPDSPDRNTEWLSGSRSPHGHKATVTLRCRSGYSMIGSATVTCEINSEWSPQPPVCERTVPPTKPTTATTTTTTTTTTPSTKGPTDDGHNLPQTLGIVFGVLISVAVIAIAGRYFCGEKIKKRGLRRDNTDKEAPHDGEAVALSQAQQSC